jgi:hypothetical protein
MQIICLFLLSLPLYSEEVLTLKDIKMMTPTYSQTQEHNQTKEFLTLSDIRKLLEK